MLGSLASQSTAASPAPAQSFPRLIVRAVLVGERIDTTGFQADNVISTSPLALRTAEGGIAVLFRYGVAVFIGFDASAERAFLNALGERIQKPAPSPEEETSIVECCEDQKETVPPGGPIRLNAFSDDRLLLVADALAKSTLLAHTEQIVGSVFDVIDPFARELAERGRIPRKRKQILKIIGRALLVHQQVSGRVAVSEKPDALWDKPELERLYERLAEEFELTERAEALARKLTVITETADALTDLIDTRRSLRLEVAIVILIVLETLAAGYQLLIGLH
jgi:uncharacterized Rmd1/YagE family protein